MSDALAWADEHLSDKVLQAFRHSQTCYHSVLPAFSMGGTPPDPPELPDDFND